MAMNTASRGLSVHSRRPHLSVYVSTVSALSCEISNVVISYSKFRFARPHSARGRSQNQHGNGRSSRCSTARAGRQLRFVQQHTFYDSGAIGRGSRGALAWRRCRTTPRGAVEVLIVLYRLLPAADCEASKPLSDDLEGVLTSLSKVLCCLTSS